MAGFLEMLDLLRGLTNGKVAAVGPFYVTVDITRQCNLHCPGCRYHSPDTPKPAGKGATPNHMPLPLFSALCDQLRSVGTTSMTISGEGEPFLHPHLPDMIAKAKAGGLNLSVYTNGTLIDEKHVEAMIDSQLDLLKVSLWATSKTEYETIYPDTPPEYFDRVMASLRLVADLKDRRKSRLPRVKLHQPIDRRNCESIGALVDIAEKTGCDILSFSPFKTQNHMFASLVPSSAEMKRVQRRLTTLRGEAKRLSITHTIDTTLFRYHIGGAVWRRLPCYIGWLHARIKPDGSVLPCNSYGVSMGNLNRADVKEIWNGRGYRHFRSQTMTKQGLATIAGRFDCYFCCHVADNFRVHQAYRWIAPFLKRRHPIKKGSR